MCQLMAEAGVDRQKSFAMLWRVGCLRCRSPSHPMFYAGPRSNLYFPRQEEKRKKVGLKRSSMTSTDGRVSRVSQPTRDSAIMSPAACCRVAICRRNCCRPFRFRVMACFSCSLSLPNPAASHSCRVPSHHPTISSSSYSELLICHLLR
ncbi:hypothetical protein SCLCIDRAFT_617248 [Scleroderma citrinum Foug A]|uniref:Uncharacterized protein n=1 Tax=Scleroderma citrinum Foug A TaxID=1036808 RepID=A0A0C3D5M2_9AGAM|nr:hypothetical protein SCLCIDRAFT_617248 [Scleroderma citrinum Foug A]